MDSGKTFFGHPVGLATLFFTEMWERFSYYGMRALLLLFLVDTIDHGGMGMEDRKAASIYGLYTMFVYLFALPGGWLADNFFGLRKAVFIGGSFIALGHLFLFITDPYTFYAGLICIVVGVGLLKPSVSSIVGGLYAHQDPNKRDSGFSIFYMGINLGAFISPFITGAIGERIDWHYGFGVAGLGMVIGLVQYKLTEKTLGSVGLEPAKLSDPKLQTLRERNIRLGLWLAGSLITLIFILVSTGIIVINPVLIAEASGVVIFVSVLAYFIYVFLFEVLNAEEKKKVGVIGILFIFSSLFWAGLEQQGSSLNLFAERYTDRMILGWEVPASWFQSIGPISIIIFSPVFAWLWIALANRKTNPSTPIKFSLALFLQAIGYLVMVAASYVVLSGHKALPSWLIFTFLLQTFGELCLSPVGLSSVTKLAPEKLVGQMMGIWFMSIAFGNLIAGRFAGEFDQNAIQSNPQLLPDLFLFIVKITAVSGLIMLLLNKPVKKLMGEVR